MVFFDKQDIFYYLVYYIVVDRHFWLLIFKTGEAHEHSGFI